MGYFSNGSEGNRYEEQYCERCIHYGPDDGPGCPVWGAHLLGNYSEASEHLILDLLIPRSADGLSNEQCLMFVAARAAGRPSDGVR